MNWLIFLCFVFFISRFCEYLMNINLKSTKPVKFFIYLINIMFELAREDIMLRDIVITILIIEAIDVFFEALEGRKNEKRHKNL